MLDINARQTPLRKRQSIIIWYIKTSTKLRTIVLHVFISVSSDNRKN